MRLRRICSTDEAFYKRCDELAKYLVERGYKEHFVKQQIQNAQSKTREEALTPRQQNTNSRVPMVVTYHPSLPNIGAMLKELQPLLHCSEKCRKAVKEMPMVAFRRPKSLRDYLVHAKLRSTRAEETPGNRGTHKCSSNRCDVCNYLVEGDRFSSNVTGASYTINHQLDCNARNVVYLINCKVCGLQYVGSTTTKFRLRFNNHKSRLRAHSKMSPANKETDDLIYKHFFSDGHQGLQDLNVQLIDRVNKKENLIDKEGQWAYQLRSLRPSGLNESNFFYSQNRGERLRN